MSRRLCDESSWAKSIIASAVVALLEAHAQAQGFFPASRVHMPYGYYGYPGSLGDLDRDGKVDLVAGTGGDSYVLLRGDGLGGFAQPVVQALSITNFSSHFARVRDINSDGRADIIVFGDDLWTINARQVHVCLGLANGTLGPDVVTALQQGFGYAPDDGLARFDADPYLDLVIIHGYTLEIDLARGTASGAFSAPSPIYASPSVALRSLVSGDIDADGDRDLILLDGNTQAIWRLTNNGDGTFAPAVNVGSAILADAITLIDVDEDARPDVVFGRNAAPWGVWFAKGLGSGAFAAPTQLFATPSNCMSVTAVDLDRDGHLELAGMMTSEWRTVVARGLGLGAYAAPQLHAAAEIGPIESADVDGDGHLDLALLGSTNTTFLLGDGGGSVVSPDVYANGTSSVRLADFNGDGTLDVAGQLSINSIGIWYGAPTGTFAAPVSFPTGANFVEWTVGDLDLDGRPDVVTTTSYTDEVRVLLGAVGGGLGAAVVFSGGSKPIHPTIGDVTGDGLPDLVVAETYTTYGSFGVPGNEVRVLRGDGLGGLLAPVSYTLADNVAYPTIADVDNDGRKDVLTSTDSGLMLQLGTPSGVLSAPTIVSALAGLFRPSVVDFDADGSLDYVGASEASGIRLVYVLLGDGLGAFPGQSILQPQGMPEAVVTADFDGNGRVDVACAVPGGFELFLQDASGVVQASRAYSDTHGQVTPPDIAASDVDGDGRVDLLTGTPSLRVSRNIGPSPRVGVYCTAKPNSNACTPQLSFSGTPSATQASGFVVSASSLVNQKSGMFFYGLNGSAAVTFHAGLRCVANPVRRTRASLSGGSPLPTSDCSGVISIDLNAFARGALGGSPDLALSIAGTHVHCQAWARDAGTASNGVQLSAGLQYFVAP